MIAINKNGLLIKNIEFEYLTDEQIKIITSNAIKQNYKAIRLIRITLLDKILAQHIIDMNTIIYLDHIDICLICDENNSEVLTQCNHQYCNECINNMVMLWKLLSIL